jgi:hypothetical protein
VGEVVEYTSEKNRGVVVKLKTVIIRIPVPPLLGLAHGVDRLGPGDLHLAADLDAGVDADHDVVAVLDLRVEVGLDLRFMIVGVVDVVIVAVVLLAQVGQIAAYGCEASC